MKKRKLSRKFDFRYLFYFALVFLPYFLAGQNNVLIDSKIAHAFSSAVSKDTFRIKAVGSTLLKAKIIFTISSGSGTEIYSATFKAVDLINEGLPKGIAASGKDQERYILKRIREFFNEKNFSQPAIRDNEEFDDDYSIQDIWMDIKSDKTAIGFNYLIGEEDNRKIAYSKKLKKAVLYFNCC